MNINIYSDIFQWDDCWNATRLRETLDAMPAADKNLDLKIHCNGGEVLEGLAMYDLLRTSGLNISATIEGGCHSIAILLLLAAPKENRYANANASALIHPVHTFTCGDNNDLATTLIENVELTNKITAIYADRTGMTQDDAWDLLETSRIYMARDLMSKGFVSEILPYNTNHKKPNKMANTKSVQTLLTNCAAFLNKATTLLTPSKVVNFNYKDKDGTTVFSTEGEEDTLAVGDAVTLPEEGDANGTYTLEDDRVVTLKDGVVESIGTEADNAVEAENARLREELNTATDLIKQLRTALQSNYTPPASTPPARIPNAGGNAKNAKDIKKMLAATKDGKDTKK
jgi:ATP-dependent Clp protease protease subunit